MYSTVQLGRMLNVSRGVFTPLLTRQYYSAVSTYRLSKFDTGKTTTGSCRATPSASRRVLTPFPIQTLSGLNLLTPARSYSDDNKVQTTALTIIKDLKHVKASPMPALVLGASGLIPFVCPPLFMMMTGTCAPGLVYAQGVYGACILSFIGGVRWGVTLPEDAIIKPNWLNLGYSIVPPLVAWVALLFPTTLGLTTLMLGLGGAAYMDITMLGYPTWFKAMRFLLTITAIISLWTTILLLFTLKEKPKKAIEQKSTASVAQPTSPASPPPTVEAQPTSPASSPPTVVAQPTSPASPPPTVVAQPNSPTSPSTAVVDQPTSLAGSPTAVEAQPTSLANLSLASVAQLISPAHLFHSDAPPRSHGHPEGEHHSWWLLEEEDPIEMFIAFEDD